MRRELLFVCGVKGKQLPAWVQTAASLTVALPREAVGEFSESFSSLGEGEKGMDMLVKFARKLGVTFATGKGIPVSGVLTVRASWLKEGDSITVELDGDVIGQLKRAFAEAAKESGGGAYVQFNLREGKPESPKVELKFSYEAAQ
ncbi:MAG: hypothetical protein HY671_07240 [Chloroflexi bacterium]|nr:hypothetical protein [Chloroflexota bacterium]